MRIVFTQRMKDRLFHVWKLKSDENDMEYIGSVKKEEGVWRLHLIGQYDTETNNKMILNSFYGQLAKREKSSQT